MTSYQKGATMWTEGEDRGKVGGNRKKSQNLIDLAAQAIASGRPDTWAGWVTYLLESLDAEASDGDFRGVLLDIERDIGVRLREGRW